MLVCIINQLSAQNLFIGKGGSMFVGAGAELAINSNVILNDTAGIKGSGTLILSSTQAQTISGSDTTNLPALKIINTQGVSSTINLLLNGSLDLGSTLLKMSGTKFIDVKNFSVIRTSGYVDGSMRKSFASSTLANSFEIGKGQYYLPVTVTYASASSAFSIEANADSSAASSLPSSFSETKFLKANWNIKAIGTSPSTYSATFTVPSGLLQNAASVAALKASVSNGSVWSSILNSSSNTSSTIIFPMGAYGRVQLGESNGITITLKAFLEGFYAGSSLMQPVLANSGIGSSTTLTDTLTLELRSATSPFNLVASSKAVLNTSGNGTFTFNNTANGNYYLVAKHRNHLATWSKNAVACGSSTSYDFSTAADKAFGDNMKAVGGVFVMYAGDANQDGFVDASDFTDIDNDNFNYASGYKISDITGDGFVDASDFTFLDNNNFNYIGIVRP